MNSKRYAIAIAVLAALAALPTARAAPPSLDAGALLDAALPYPQPETPGWEAHPQDSDQDDEQDEALRRDAGVEEYDAGQEAPISALVSDESPTLRAPDGAPAPIAAADRPAVAIGTLLGLLTLLALAYLGGHPRVQTLERKLGVSQVVTAGFPFVLIGLLARAPQLAPLSDALLADLGPLLRIGLGSIGFVTGFRVSAQLSPTLGAPLLRLAACCTLVPFLVVVGVSGGALLILSSPASTDVLRDPTFVRDALLLGTAGAMTAKTSAAVFRADDPQGLLARVLRLEDLSGILGLAVVAAYFRPSAEVSWQLPGTAWLLMTVGLGTTLGAIAYAVFRRPQESPDFVVLTLGSIGFGAGLAGYLRLSPVVVCFLAGTYLARLPEHPRARLHAALRRLERPVYLLALLAIGALWPISDWRGWVLVPLFTGARLAGKWLGVWCGTRYAGAALSPSDRQALAISPMGPLAIAIVLNAQLLYPDSASSLLIAAVIGGAVVTEVIVQLASRRTAPGTSPGDDDTLRREPESA